MGHESRSRRETTADMTVAEYESGRWYIERPDLRCSADKCRFVTVAGPFKTEPEARSYLRHLTDLAEVQRKADFHKAAMDFGRSLRDDK